MRYTERDISPILLKASRSFPAVVLTGPRRAGKTMLLRKLFPKASYTLMEDPDVIARVRADPQGFLDGLQLPAVLDEVQNVPEIFSFVRSRIDRNPRRTGQWFLTGSQDAPLMQGVTESMAGRAALLQLYPLATTESPRVDLFLGGYPEAVARPASASLWFSSYVQTYLERDVRAVTNVRDLATYRRFMSMLATRHGQLLNRTELAAPLGVSVPTVNQWINVLETTQQILLVPPYHGNLGKRLVKSPKVYFMDSGLACHLLGIASRAELDRSPFKGALFEGFVAAEVVKRQVNKGLRKEIYHYRDEHGLEVDFIVPGRNSGISLLECKASRTPVPSMAASMLRVRDILKEKQEPKRSFSLSLVYRPAKATPLASLGNGAKAMDLATWLGRAR